MKSRFLSLILHCNLKRVGGSLMSLFRFVSDEEPNKYLQIDPTNIYKTTQIIGGSTYVQFNVIILVLVLNNILHFFLIYIIFIVNLIEGMLLFVQKHLQNAFYKLRFFCPELFVHLFILGKVNCRGQCKVFFICLTEKADEH